MKYSNVARCSICALMIGTSYAYAEPMPDKQLSIKEVHSSPDYRTSLNDYLAQMAERNSREQITYLLSTWGSLWNQNRPDEMRRLYSHDALLTIDDQAFENGIENVLSKVIKTDPSVDLSISEILIDGERAFADLKLTGKAINSVWMEFEKQNNRWHITRFDYR